MGKAVRQIGAEQDVGHGTTHVERQAGDAGAGPEGAATAFGGFDEAAAAGPVDIGDVPTPAAEQESPWSLHLFDEDGGIDPADFGASGEDRELRGSGEHGGHAHEVSTSEAQFGFGSDEQVLA